MKKFTFDELYERAEKRVNEKWTKGGYVKVNKWVHPKNPNEIRYYINLCNRTHRRQIPAGYWVDNDETNVHEYVPNLRLDLREAEL